MRRRTKKVLKLTARSAALAVQLLLEEGKIAAADAARPLKHRERLIKELRAKLAALENASMPVARKVASAGRRAARRSAPHARKAITRAQRIARQAQGRYMAAVRRLSADARARIRQIREESGVGAAIEAARKMAK